MKPQDKSDPRKANPRKTLRGGIDAALSNPNNKTSPQSETAETPGFWQGALGYPQAVVLAVTLFLLGLALHATVGDRLPLKANPVAWLMAAAVPVMLVLGRTHRTHRVVHWLTGIPVAVTSTTTVGILALVGGVVPQDVVQQRFGAESVWVSWPFLLQVELMLLNLVGSVGKRSWPLNYTNIVYLTNHAGLAIAIIGGAISALYLERNIVVLFPGQPTNFAYTKEGETIPLPFELTLQEFHLDSFPPVLAIARLDPTAPDGVTSKASEDFVAQGQTISVDGHSIKVEKFLPKAIFAGGEFKAAPWKSAAPAAFLTVTKPNGEKTTGWVCAGSVDVPAEYIRLGDATALLMPEPRPKEFRSDLVLRHKNQDPAQATKHTIKVNSPLTIGDTTVYQLSYDDKAGAASAYSTLEVVTDRGLWYVYAGFFLMLAGSALHLWNGALSPKAHLKTEPENPTPNHKDTPTGESK